MTENWRLGDAFKTGDYVTTNTWERWESLSPEERARIEQRYERNRNYQGMNRDWQ